MMISFEQVRRRKIGKTNKSSTGANMPSGTEANALAVRIGKNLNSHPNG